MKHLIQTAFTLGVIVMTSFAFATEHEVKMLNAGEDGTMVFEPGFLKIEPGDTVKFISADPGHNSASHFTPDGGVTWKGDMNQDVTVTFDKEGIYIYKCEPHVVMAMVGVIQVGKAVNKDEATQAASEFSTQIAMSKDRLENYMTMTN